MGLNMIGPARQDTMTPTTPTSASAASRSSERKPCFCREESLAPLIVQSLMASVLGILLMGGFLYGACVYELPQDAPSSGPAFR